MKNAPVLKHKLTPNPRQNRVACLASDSLVENKKDLAFIQSKLASTCLRFFAQSSDRTLVTTRTAACSHISNWCKQEGIGLKRVTKMIPLDSIGSDQTSEGVQALFALWDASKAIFFWDYSRDHVMQALTAAWRMHSIVDMRIWIKHEDGEWRQHNQQL